MPLKPEDTFDIFAGDQKPILIAGPTASGKSSFALSLAREFDGVVVNADALQVYDVWHVLSARPSDEEEAQAPHLLYGHIDAAATYSVGHWLREVQDILATTAKRPIIIGGTGLYFSALSEGLADIPPTPDDIRAQGNELARDKGLGIFAELLAQNDPETAARIDMNNPARTQRAWEIWQTTGKSMAQWHAETPSPILPLSDAHGVVLSLPVETLNTRIDQRFDQMIAMGALDEVRDFMERGIDLNHPSAQAIGAKELIQYLENTLTLVEAIHTSKLKTRQYAKRQRTWFRNRLKNWEVISVV